MMLSGVFQLFEGIAGIAKDQFFVVGANYAYEIDTTTWGWIHVAVGAVVAVTGFFLLTNAAWARVVAIGLVMIQALAQFFWLPYYPLWSLLIIALDIFVIWAILRAPETSAMDVDRQRARQYEQQQQQQYERH